MPNVFLVVKYWVLYVKVFTVWVFFGGKKSSECEGCDVVDKQMSFVSSSCFVAPLVMLAAVCRRESARESTVSANKQ